MYGKQPAEGKWQRVAAATGLPIFPIRVYRDASGKWQKVPLTPHGHLDASFEASRFDWSGANGFGARMGETATGVGYYALDVDDPSTDGPPARWLAHWGVPMDTRQVRTVSGGIHLIYQLPGAHTRLPNRAAIVPGLDARGEGGWVAFAEGYEVLQGYLPATLPARVCDELQRGWKGGASGLGGPVELAYAPPDAGEAEAKLARKLDVFNDRLLRRWGGEKPTGDQSASGLDMSIARILANAGMTQDEITWVLTHRFEHGVVARDGLTPKTLRGAIRCAAKARAAADAATAALEVAAPTVSKETFEKHSKLIEW